MKHKFITVIFACAIILVAFAYAQNNKKDKSTKEPESIKIQTETSIKLIEPIPENKKYEHKMMPLECKTCHDCDYPTKNQPCLKMCPRADLITVYHSANEGPVVVHMDEVKGDFGEVSFSHKIHAQMSEMAGGCETCHHYNTTGPVLKCRACHSDKRVRDDYRIPDLEAAYHRQCLNCHRQWTGSTDCQECHVKKGEDINKIRKDKIAKFQAKSHPKLIEPNKVVYETKYEQGKVVTFHHQEHTHLYNIACKTCHGNDNCINCHTAMNKELSKSNLTHKKTHKSFQEHHEPCLSCHDQNNCGKCHMNQAMGSFNHAQRTGFDLGKNHNKLKCEICHKTTGKFTGLDKNCTSCHQNFVLGKFKHQVTGLMLDDTHNEFECSSCHPNNNFSGKVVCSECHEGFIYPAKKPGKLVLKR